MTSHVFWPFLTYLPTLSYSITSPFLGYLGPPYLLVLLPTLISDVINGCSPTIFFANLIDTCLFWCWGFISYLTYFTPNTSHFCWLLEAFWCSLATNLSSFEHFCLCWSQWGAISIQWMNMYSKCTISFFSSILISLRDLYFHWLHT